mmetsp:Transcript_1743/g.6378  ORF Transcript_1743/g.6378 Transcript_1743/m.6378 type:complete len:292 (-) Transcript_1743:21-896(-)
MRESVHQPVAFHAPRVEQQPKNPVSDFIIGLYSAAGTVFLRVAAFSEANMSITGWPVFVLPTTGMPSSLNCSKSFVAPTSASNAAMLSFKRCLEKFKLSLTALIRPFTLPIVPCSRFLVDATVDKSTEYSLCKSSISATDAPSSTVEPYMIEYPTNEFSSPPAMSSSPPPIERVLHLSARPPPLPFPPRDAPVRFSENDSNCLTSDVNAASASPSLSSTSLSGAPARAPPRPPSCPVSSSLKDRSARSVSSTACIVAVRVFDNLALTSSALRNAFAVDAPRLDRLVDIARR